VQGQKSRRRHRHPALFQGIEEIDEHKFKTRYKSVKIPLMNTYHFKLYKNRRQAVLIEAWWICRIVADRNDRLYYVKQKGL
jgi:hypothetical protein